MSMVMDFPALNGDVVTEAHAKICRERGHANHTVDGVASSICPRCGDKRPLKDIMSAQPPTTIAAYVDGVCVRIDPRQDVIDSVIELAMKADFIDRDHYFSERIVFGSGRTALIFKLRG